ncbi:MAG: hypothetical protein AB8G23_20020 [Myxococcota bacterium]
MAEILVEPDPHARTQALLNYFKGATGADLPEIEAAYSEARPFLDPVSVSLLAQWWVQFDPVAAYNDGLNAVWMERRLWASAVFREWARIAPEAALEMAMAIPKESGQEWRRTVSLALIRGWFDGGAEPAPLLDLIFRLPLGRPQKESLDILLVRLMEREDTAQAMAFVEGLPEGPLRPLKLDAFKRMATVLTQEDPALGVAWVEKHGSGPFGKNLAIRVGRVWGRVGGAPALDWAMQLPADTPDRDRVLVEAFRGWSSNDAAGSLEWVKQQEATPAIAGVLKLSVQREAREDAKAAIDRASAVEDQALRNSLLAEAGRIWINLDREAAEAWIATAELPATTLSFIRKPLPGQPAIPTVP